MISEFAPRRLKFGDEKLLKGQEVYARRTRRNVFTGEVPAIITPPDFRNTYIITAFIGIDERSSLIHFRINKAQNNADQFALDLEMAVISGFLLSGDVLVLDNAVYHTGGGNTVLESWMWEEYGFFILFLPARMPEWNPTELAWRALVQGLKKNPLSILCKMGTYSPVHAAHYVMSDFTHDQMRSFYKLCKVLKGDNSYR